jgi:hypothetical protein
MRLTVVGPKQVPTGSSVVTNELFTVADGKPRHVTRAKVEFAVSTNVLRCKNIKDALELALYEQNGNTVCEKEGA